MIGKQFKCTSFRKVLNYLHHKPGARRIGGNVASATLDQLVKEFYESRKLNPGLKRAVYHASLSVASIEAMDDDRWMDIAEDYLQGMGFGNSQYVVYRHHDANHDHIHMVASRIRIGDGFIVSDSWDYRRSEVLIRKLEQDYQLKSTEPSWEKPKRAQSAGEFRQQLRTGQPSARQRLCPILDWAAVQSGTMPEYIQQVQEAGVEVRVSKKGISYAFEGVAFSGSQLGRDYSFNGLQKYRGISYAFERDDQVLEELIAVEREQFQLETQLSSSSEHPNIDLDTISTVQSERGFSTQVAATQVQLEL